MSESLHELEAALADAQREAALAEDSYTFRRARYDEKPTDKRHGRMLVAFQQRTDAAVRYSTAYYALAQAKKAEHPPLKEGMDLEVTADVVDELRDSGQLYDVDPQVATDELDNPAAPIVEVETSGRHRADEVECFCDQWSDAHTVADHALRDKAGPELADTETPVVTLAPVNGDGRFVPIGTIADGPAEGATAYMEQGYVRNEQGAYEYDGPVGEQPDVPAWDGVTPAPGNPEWESTIRNLYGISADIPIVAHKEMWTTWDGRTQSRTSYKPGEQPEIPHHTHTVNPDPRALKEPRVIATRRLGERFQGLPVYVQDGMAKDTVYVLPSQGSQEGAVLMGSDTFAALQSKMDEVRQPNPDVASAFDLKAKLDRLRNVARSVGALDGVSDPVSKAEADEAMGPTAEEQAVIDAGKAAQAKVDREGFTVFGAPSGTSPFSYTEAFAKAGDVPSAPADHVTATLGDTVTVEPDEAAAHVKDFAADSFKMPPPRDFTVTGEIRDAQPAFFEKVFPNARVVIGSNGKVEITANSVDNAAKAADEPTTPEGKLLAEAAQIIGHDRNDQYGNAEDSFGVIAEFWSTWLTARRFELTEIDIDSVESITVTAADVANMLGLMKKARTAVGGYKHDSYVDEAGYVALAERCEAKGSGL